MEPFIGRVPFLTEAQAAAQLRHFSFNAAAPLLQDMPPWWVRLSHEQRFIVTRRSVHRSAIRQWYAWFCTNPDVTEADIAMVKQDLDGYYHAQPTMVESLRNLRLMGYAPVVVGMMSARERVLGSGAAFARRYQAEVADEDFNILSDAELCVRVVLRHPDRREKTGIYLVLAAYEALDMLMANFSRTCALVKADRGRALRREEYQMVMETLIRWLAQRGGESRSGFSRSRVCFLRLARLALRASARLSVLCLGLCFMDSNIYIFA